MPHNDSGNRPSPSEIAGIIRLSKDAIVTCQLDGTITGWNPSAERMCGYEPEEILGQSFFKKLFAAGDPADPFPFIVERIRQGEIIEDLETQWISRDGRTLDVALTFAPLHNERDIAVGIICIATDLGIRNRLRRAERDQLFL